MKLVLQRTAPSEKEAHTGTAHPISLETHNSTSSRRLRVAATHIMTATASRNAKAGTNHCGAG